MIKHVLSAVERALDSQIHLDVDPDVVTQAAERMIAQYTGQTTSSKVGIFQVKQVWELGNIANWLAAEIAKHGEDPGDMRHRETLARELRRVWDAIGNTLPDSVPEGTWWWQVAQGILAEAQREGVRPAANSANWQLDTG